MPPKLSPQSAAEQAVAAIGAGYDLCADVRLSSCKRTRSRSTLVDLDGTRRDLVFPGGVVVADVPASIKCDKGERTRFTSDVLSFNQMSEQFNQALSLSGKIPCGLFNTMFNFKGSWQKDASTTKSLAFDGWLMTLYNIELSRTNLTLSEQVKNEVPSSWDPAALAEFIEKYGTHIIVGVKMGGKDVVHIKQFQNSALPPTEVQKLLKKLADERFSEDATVSGRRATVDVAESSRKVKDEHSTPWHLQGVFPSNVRPPVITRSKNNETESICVRRGGVDMGQSHNQWLSTVSESPNVISMSFVPITSLLSGLRGNGFLSHAVNLYLRYKPPIEELHQFLEFQLPRQWAPVYGDLPLGLRRKKHVSPSLQFSLMGPKLYVNITQVDSGNRPVTGIRLYLEGKKSDHLAIHLQHLTSLPTILQLSDHNTTNNNNLNLINEPIPRAYLEPVKWTIFSHVCTSPVQYDGSRIDDSASIVTKAWLEVKTIGMKKVLFLKLGFSMVASARIRRSEWEGPATSSSRKSGVLTSMLMMSSKLSAPLYPPEEAARKVDLNSAVFAGGPPAPARAPRMEAFVETKEMARGPEDFPGYWVVTGAKLSLEGGKISTKVKFSLLAIMSDDSMMLM